MHASSTTTTELEDVKVPVKLKLAGLWASFMFLYVYVDVIGFYKPGVIDSIRAGFMWEFEVTQTLMVAMLALVTIPGLMVFLSLALPARANRLTNILVAALYIPVSVFNVIGEAWVFYYWSAVIVEVVLLSLAIRYAWTWPAAETRPGSVPIASAAQPVGETVLRRQRVEMPSS